MESDTPYPNYANNRDVMNFVLQGGRMSKPKNCPNAVYEIMTKTWEEKPEDRPSFAALLKDLEHLSGEDLGISEKYVAPPETYFYSLTKDDKGTSWYA